MSKRMLKAIKIMLLGAVIITTAVLHTISLEKIPSGLYKDESAIGYNAVLIRDTGMDEHDERLPLYFRSFDDMKDPVSIYATSLMFHVLPPSIFSLRLTSAIAFLVGYIGILILVALATKNNFSAILFAAVGAGFLPWLFSVSRIAFPAVFLVASIIWCLVFLHLAFYKPQSKRTYFYAILCGSILGFSIYTYAPARLLAPTLFGLIAICFFRLKTWKISSAITGCFAFTSIPYIHFSFLGQNDVGMRFKLLTYIFSADLSFMEKVQMFFQQYSHYFYWSFLFVTGDPNTRHGTKFTGQLHAALGIAIAVYIFFFIKKRLWRQPFDALLIGGLLSSPFAAALTTGKVHGLRSIPLPVFALLLGALGIFHLHQTKKRLAIIFTWILLLVLSVESGLYLDDYFGRYASDFDKNAQAFRTLGAYESLETALKIIPPPDEIIFSRRIKYSNIEFYKIITENPSYIPIKSGSSIPKKDTCLIYHFCQEKGCGKNDKKKPLDAYDLSYTSPEFTHPLFEKFIFKLRCY